MHAHLRRSGGSLTVTVPAQFRREHSLREGDEVIIESEGDTLRIRPVQRKRVTLKAILDAAPDDAKSMRADGWDALPATGGEW